MTTDLLQTPRPIGGFRAISADPPWAFLTRSGAAQLPQRAQAEQHYTTMSREELRRMPVREMAHRDCVLFMWVVDSHLDQGIDLGTDWGFTFKTRVFTWRKTSMDGKSCPMGMGKWSRKQTELVLLFTRGSPSPQSHGVREIIDAPRREHSQKPDEIYGRIEALARGPYLELFARKAHPGWSAWGNDVGRFT